MSRLSALLVAACLCTLGAAGVTQAAVHGHATVKHRKTVTHPKVHGLAAPGLLTPANGAHVEQVPTLTWNAVSGAVEYEYQVAADPHFDSIVLGTGTGKGAASTDNLAAALEKSVTDGTYYWRVRALTASKEPGPWSSTRSLTKAWSEAPQLLGPGEGAAITWPSVPLILSWTPVKHATEYIVTIATDRELSHVVLGSASSPTKTRGTVFALPGTLPTGQYYWVITPVDAQGHRGTASIVRTFNWSWPTQTATSLTPLNAELGETSLKWTPEFTWNAVPGAARYEVEVNTAEGFPQGSTWFKGTTIGTTMSPLMPLNSAEYYWRVRAIDSEGNAGVWNEGPRFTKVFDNETPTIHNLRLVDIEGNTVAESPTKGAPIVTGTPIATWSPVAGAASYEVAVDPLGKETCQSGKGEIAATPAWTPLASGGHIGQENWPSTQSGMSLEPGETYSLEVAARSDVDEFGHQIESALTPLDCGPFRFKYEPRTYRCTQALAYEEKGEDSRAGEIYDANAGTEHPEYERLSRKTCIEETGPPEKTDIPTYLPSSAYVLPERGSLSARTPLFTWKPVPRADCYYIAIARNPEFTNVADVAETYGTAYAPPVGGEEPLDDETTTYYWTVFAVIPTSETSKPCSGARYANGPEYEEVYSVFDKSSVPPTLLAPANGVEISTQPTFKWTPTEGALNYTLEVSQNPTFGEPIEEEKTDSTSYTAAKTYPANTTLYWRVRANDANKDQHEGLNWSPVQSFKRTLPVPVLTSSNPTSTESIPAFDFSAVPGATGYEVHVEEPNGSTKEFSFDSTAFTPTEWYGPGVWRWQVRAQFPNNGFGSVLGPYSAPQAVAHTEGQPSGVVGEKSGSRIVISWNPLPYAKEYEVEISDVNTFTTTVESHRTEQSSWAPNVNLAKKENKGRLYWRVAAVDSHGNLGPPVSGTFVPPKAKAKCVVKKVKKGKKTVKVCVATKHKATKTKTKRG